MIDLTKMTLDEVREIVEGTVDGHEVRIYANDGKGKYPIHGAISMKEEWLSAEWTKEGEWHWRVGVSKDWGLVFKPKTIDFSQLPVDTLVKVEGYGLRYLAKQVDSRKQMVRFFGLGTTSSTAEVSEFIDNRFLSLVEGRVEPWLGGECPLPDRVKVKCWDRLGRIETMNCIDAKWYTTGEDEDLMYYQITGEIV